MINKVLRFFVILFMFFCCYSSADDEDIFYLPDGDISVDLGGGYSAVPDEAGEYQFLPPSIYRDPLVDSRYGAIRGAEFLNFPDYNLPKTDSRVQEEEYTDEYKEYIFHQATTSTEGNQLWGFSD